VGGQIRDECYDLVNIFVEEIDVFTQKLALYSKN
jgi:hypothetical protein